MLFQLYKSPIQSHIWVELSPHIYLFTFWAWSNIVAFRYFGHPPHTFINKVHQKWFIRSSPSPLKKGKEEKRESEWGDTLTRAKKRERTKGKDGEAKVKHHSKGHSPLTHTYTWPSSKGDMISQRQDLWPCKINEEDMQVYPNLEPHKSLFKRRRGFLERP